MYVLCALLVLFFAQCICPFVAFVGAVNLRTKTAWQRRFVVLFVLVFVLSVIVFP